VFAIRLAVIPLSTVPVLAPIAGHFYKASHPILLSILQLASVFVPVCIHARALPILLAVLPRSIVLVPITVSALSLAILLAVRPLPIVPVPIVKKNFLATFNR
jgi:hypothetical protein